MSTRQWWQTVSAVFLGAFAAALLWVVLHRIWPSLVLFGVGIAIAQLLDPFLDRLQARGLTRLQSVWIVSLLAVIGLGLLATWLVPTLLMQVQSIARAWPTYTARANELYDRASQWVLARVENEQLQAQYGQYLDKQWEELQTRLAERMPDLVAWASGQVFRWAGWFFILFLLVVISFHFMLVIDDFREGLKRVIPAAAEPHVTTILTQINYLLGQYVRGLVTTAVTVGAFTAAGLGLASLYFGTRYWLLIGFLAGLLYFVPWVGGAVAQALAVFFGYTTAATEAPWAAGVNWLIVIGINQLGDTVLMPRIVGRRVGLHPLAVLFGVLAGYQLFGIVGVMLATPLMVCIKIILAHWLPVKGAPPTERQPREPLALDLGGSLSKAFSLVRGWGSRIERAVSGAPASVEGDSQDEAPSATPPGTAPEAEGSQSTEGTEPSSEQAPPDPGDQPDDSDGPTSESE
ncbi:MAG: AI-2E family transporter [Armatimonadetes bacterium]|nr:AI-2E family transporter [Armatimonadota bacterium]